MCWQRQDKSLECDGRRLYLLAMITGLKLQARDAEDVAVISAILQDAIVAVGDMIYRPATGEFIFAASRFCWESAKQTPPVYQRVNCALTVTGVTAAQLQGVDLTAKQTMHELLAVLAEPQGLRFVFAGSAGVRLTLADWQVRLEDFGAAWPTPQCPRHAAQVEP
jgi:hypothetical protein